MSNVIPFPSRNNDDFDDGWGNSECECDRCGEMFEKSGNYEECTTPALGSTIRFHSGFNEFDDLTSFELELCHDCTVSVYKFFLGTNKYSDLFKEKIGHCHESPLGEHQCCEFSYPVKY